jgi:hypothetical protein
MTNLVGMEFRMKSRMNWKTGLIALAAILAINLRSWLGGPDTLAGLSVSRVWTWAPWVLLVVLWGVLFRQLRQKGILGGSETAEQGAVECPA